MNSFPATPNAGWQPQREVELIVGTPPGGGQDRPARALMKVLSAAGIVTVPMKLSNIVGKGGGAAWDALRARGGDPHVLSINSGPLLSNRILGVADYDHTAFTPLANLYTEYLAFIVRADSPLADAGAFLQRLQQDPASFDIAFATAIGSTNHIALGHVMKHLNHDPRQLKLRVFDSALYAVADVLEGNAQAGVISAVSAVKALQEGRARALAVTAPTRLGGVFASAPTWQELGVPCVAGQWRGIMGGAGPHGMSAAQVSFWEQAFAAATARAQWHDELTANYWTNTFMGAQAARALLDGERDQLARMLRALGLAD
ncbi:MAG: tripartite tricarboxylate transporter substrate binding protein [Betaproteobacteria bacterium]|nr:tripartite tricarboxylate transporter substrate binding protein [Betaproteobacteria bacterium]